VNHYTKLVKGYQLDSSAIAFDITDTFEESDDIKVVNMLSDIHFK
jgi:hypothetical protein